MGFLHLLSKCANSFATSYKVHEAAVANHQILTQKTAPIFQHPFCVTRKERQAVQYQVRELLFENIIQSIKSPWKAPVDLVKKKDISLRYHAAYRELINIAQKDIYSLPASATGCIVFAECLWAYRAATNKSNSTNATERRWHSSRRMSSSVLSNFI